MLKRVLLWTLGLSVAAFLALIAYAVIFFTWNFDSAGNSDARRESVLWFDAEIAQHVCLTPTVLHDIAAKREWLVETHDEIRWCVNRDDINDWHSVTIEPSLAFSNDDENRRYFGFDGQGCSADWSYSSDC